MAEKSHAWTSILIVAFFPGGAFAQGRVPEFRSRFAHDTDPVHRARMMPQLEEAEFEAIAKNADDGKFPEALNILEEFRNQAESCEKGLDAKSINAEKHPNGFKQLQLALRESMRHLDALLVSFTADEQKPFLKLRGDLEQMDRHVIRELFPNGASNEPGKEPRTVPASSTENDLKTRANDQTDTEQSAEPSTGPSNDPQNENGTDDTPNEEKGDAPGQETAPAK